MHVLDEVHASGSYRWNKNQWQLQIPHLLLIRHNLHNYNTLKSDL